MIEDRLLGKISYEERCFPAPTMEALINVPMLICMAEGQAVVTRAYDLVSTANSDIKATSQQNTG